MKIPEYIYLQIEGESSFGNEIDSRSLYEEENVTWCVDRINQSDAEFVNANLVREYLDVLEEVAKLEYRDSDLVSLLETLRTRASQVLRLANKNLEPTGETGGSN